MLTLNVLAVICPLQNVLTAVRKAFDVFFLRYPYCYGYWKKYADIEKKHENIQVAEEVNISIFWTHTHICCSLFVYAWEIFSRSPAVLFLPCPFHVAHYYKYTDSRPHTLETIHQLFLSLRQRGKMRGALMNVVKLSQPLTGLFVFGVSQGLQKRFAGHPSQCGPVAALPGLHQRELRPEWPRDWGTHSSVSDRLLLYSRTAELIQC